MTDYVSREVARERLRKACKAGGVVSVLFMLAGLFYGAIAAVVAMHVSLPFDVMYDVLYLLVPTMGDTVLAMGESATRGVLLFLMGLISLLMFRKVSKTGDAFSLGQMRQLRFVSLLVLLLGFLPTLVANVVKIVLSVRAGGPPLAALSLAINGMCIICGLLLFMAARVLVAGAALGRQEEEAALSPDVTDVGVPDYSGVPDIASVTTAQPMAQTMSAERVPQVPAPEEMPHFVSDPAWDDVAAQSDAAAGQADENA